MRAGQRSERVEIQRPADGQDNLGQPIVGWVLVRPVWAYILHRSGIEAIRANAPTSIVQASVRIPWLAANGVTTAMRVVCSDGTAYGIKAIMPDRVKREYVDMVCETGASDG